MFKCPVCDTEYAELLTDRCSVCSWEFTPDPLALDGKLNLSDWEKEQARIEWARKMWANSQQLIAQLSKEKKGKSKKKATAKKTANSQLQIRLEALQDQLQQASAERAYLQSQLEWVLYRLEQLHPEEISATLSRLEAAIATLPASTPPLSEVGIDYNPLIQLLAAGKWQKADELTWELILRARLREEEGWLTAEDLANFPCTDLCTIDQFWDYYSGGRFSLTAQYRIWESVGQQYTEFCNQVGWRAKENWKYYEDLNFSLSAPEGHLPVLAWRRRACYGAGQLMAAESFFVLILRVLTCQNPSRVEG